MKRVKCFLTFHRIILSSLSSSPHPSLLPYIAQGKRFNLHSHHHHQLHHQLHHEVHQLHPIDSVKQVQTGFLCALSMTLLSSPLVRLISSITPLIEEDNRPPLIQLMLYNWSPVTIQVLLLVICSASSLLSSPPSADLTFTSHSLNHLSLSITTTHEWNKSKHTFYFSVSSLLHFFTSSSRSLVTASHCALVSSSLLRRHTASSS